MKATFEQNGLGSGALAAPAATHHADDVPVSRNGMLEYQRYQSFPLRLPPCIWSQVKLLAGREGVSLNQFIREAIGEKMVRLKSSPHSE